MVRVKCNASGIRLRKSNLDSIPPNWWAVRVWESWLPKTNCLIIYWLALPTRISVSIKKAFCLFSFHPEWSLALTWYLINIHCLSADFFSDTFSPKVIMSNWFVPLSFSAFQPTPSSTHHHHPCQEFLGLSVLVTEGFLLLVTYLVKCVVIIIKVSIISNTFSKPSDSAYSDPSTV